MVINMIVAGLAGTGIPILLERMGVDPALASGAFVTTVTDVVGFFGGCGARVEADAEVGVLGLALCAEGLEEAGRR